ncbi:syncoilin [Engraulis encrasicolus]|uniref:syncoilin n=1 Tax=Engraulis encrasicolus TaxID=184585 RepID=UPI002FD5B579
MESAATTMNQGVSEDPGPGEQMSSVGIEHEGEDGNTLQGNTLHLLQGEVSPNSGNMIESKLVDVTITDYAQPQFVEIRDASTMEITTQVTSMQESNSFIPEPSVLEFVQTSACVTTAEISASPTQPITPLSPFTVQSPSSPLSSVQSLTSLHPTQSQQTCAPVSDEHGCGDMDVSPPAHPLPEPTDFSPHTDQSSPKEEMDSPSPAQSSPPTPAHTSQIPLPVSISVLCFAPLPAQTSAPLQWEVEREVSAHLDGCLEEVRALEERRDTLIQELMELESPMMEAVQALQGELGQACGLLTRSQLRLLRLQEEVRQVKRKLLSATRHCIMSQVQLSALQYEVAQSAIMQEELQSDILDRLQEIADLREEHKKQMDTLRVRRRRRPRTMSDLSHSRRFSDDLSRYTCNNMKMLESWYEPRVLALLRRRQNTEEMLRRSQALVEELRARLCPLQEEVHKLTLQRNCMEQRIALMEQEREENVNRYKESILCMEESMRELRTEVQIQGMANAELKQLKNSLILELRSYGCSINIDDHTDSGSGEGADF